MAGPTDILEPDDLARVKGLQFFARTIVEGFTTGLHASPHKGFSVEFKQRRPYVPGDEIRHVDWKVFARSDRYYIREFEEETNVRAHLLLDASGSMGYRGTGGIEKLDYARKTAACLAYLLMGQQDSVGLATFDTQVREFVPNRSRTSHLAVLLHALEMAAPGGETALPEVLLELVPRLQRRGLVLLISDCFGEVAPFVKALSLIRSRGHEVIVFQIWDRDELEFPFQRSTRLINLESRADAQIVDPASLRRSYLENLAAYREELAFGCRRHHVDLVPLVTDEPYAKSLSRYLDLRLRS